MGTLLAEKRMSLNDLARREGKNPSTIWRWASRGVNGVRLEVFPIGGRTWTTEEAFERWVAGVKAAKDGATTIPPIATTRQRDAAARGAEAELTAAGF